MTQNNGSDAPLQPQRPPWSAPRQHHNTSAEAAQGGAAAPPERRCCAASAQAARAPQPLTRPSKTGRQTTPCWARCCRKAPAACQAARQSRGAGRWARRGAGACAAAGRPRQTQLQRRSRAATRCVPPAGAHRARAAESAGAPRRQAQRRKGCGAAKPVIGRQRNGRARPAAARRLRCREHAAERVHVGAEAALAPCCERQMRSQRDWLPTLRAGRQAHPCRALVASSRSSAARLKLRA